MCNDKRLSNNVGINRNYFKQKHRKRSKKKEGKFAKKRNALQVPGSGSFPNAKGDINEDSILWEHKYTDKSYIILFGTWINKIKKYATQLNKEYALIIELNCSSIRKNYYSDWVVVSKDFYRKIFNKNIDKLNIYSGSGEKCIKLSLKKLQKKYFKNNTPMIINIGENECIIMSYDYFDIGFKKWNTE